MASDDTMPDADSILANLGVTPGERATKTRQTAQNKRDASKRPPRAKAEREETPAPNAPLTPTERRLKESIAEIYVLGAMGATFAGDPTIAVIITEHAERAAEAWVKLARKDARVKSWLNKLTTGSAYGDVILVHVMMVMGILAAKGLVPGMPIMPDYPPAETETPQ